MSEKDTNNRGARAQVDTKRDPMDTEGMTYQQAIGYKALILAAWAYMQRKYNGR